MNTFLAIAWRNIWRNKRRSFLTISMITFGLFLSILSESLAIGSHEMIFKNAIELNIGSFQIHAKDYQENLTLSESFEMTPEIENILKSEPLIQGWTERIVSGGMVSVGENTNVAVITGIDPDREAHISTLEDKVITGKRLLKKYPSIYSEAPLSRFLSNEPKMEIMMGDKLAEKLAAKIGDKAAAMVQGADGSMGNDLYTIVGIYHTGAADLDNGFYMHIREADELFSTYGSVSLLAVALPNSKVIPEVLQRVKNQMDLNIYEVMAWDEVAPDIVEFMELDSVGHYMFLFILLMIIAFGVLNTVFITIIERIKEFGVLKALGTSPAQIFRLIIFETFFLTLIGAILGNIFGAMFAFYFNRNPIDLSGMTEMYEDFGISLVTLPAAVEPGMFVNFTILVFFLALFAAIFPAYKAARLEPIEALKHV